MFCKMRLIVFISANFLFVNKIQGTPEGDCYVRGVEDIHWLTGYHNDPVDDFEENQFKRFLIKNIENVQVTGDDYGKYFNVMVEKNHLLILLTNDFRNFEINEKSTNDPIINVLLNFKCKTGTRQLSFYQPIRDSNTYGPEFDQRSYTYNLPMPLPAAFDISAFGDKIEACDMDISNVHLHFAITGEADFSISWSSTTNDTNKCHKAVMTTKHPLRLKNNKIYNITVTDIGIPPRNDSVSLIVEINEKNSLPLSPEFENAYYTASYHNTQDHNHSIHVDKPIRLNEECSKIKVDTLEYKENFRVDCHSNEVHVELIRKLTNDVLKSNSVVAVTIQATMSQFKEPARTVLEVYIKQEPLGIGGSCTTTLSPMECPSCSTVSNECSTPMFNCSYLSSKGLTHSGCMTTPETPTQPLIYFINDVYLFEAKFHYEGYIGKVEAIVIPEEDIEYSVVAASNETNIVECDKRTGVLRLIKTMGCESYKFIAFAEGVDTKVKTETRVELKRTISYTVDNTHSMLIEHVTEETKEVIPLPYLDSYCWYLITEVYPKTQYEKFGAFYHEFSMSLYVLNIDRESIDGPQIMLTLTSKGCDEFPYGDSGFNDKHVLSKRSINSEEISREWVFVPSEIIYKPNRLFLIIIVDDINDNSPIFEVGKKLVIGYPHKILAALLRLPYLVKVTATDLDVGENATIRYSTENAHFVIHPTTGVVYPGKHAFNNESNLRFVVTATDRNGAEDGLSTDLEIEVKLLTKEHILAILVQNITSENVDIFIQNLSDHTNLTVKYLTAAVVPICFCNNSSKEHANNSLDYFTKIFIYALNEEGEPVEAHNLQKKVQGSYMLKDYMNHQWKLKTLTIDYKYDYDHMEPDISDCIVINSFLVLLLTCFMITASILYYFKVYKNK